MRAIFIAVVLACTSQPALAKPGNGMPAIWFKAEIKNPIGTGNVVRLSDDRWQVSCTELIDGCTRLASESCTSGFTEVGRTYDPANRNRMTIVIECHQ